jgi:PPOX class probable FMN-dependent enzyme
VRSPRRDGRAKPRTPARPGNAPGRRRTNGCAQTGRNEDGGASGHDRHARGAAQPVCNANRARAAQADRGPRRARAALRRALALLVLATCDAAHRLDASPRGGEPGFVKVEAEGDLLVPDAPGNNRLDSLENLVRVGRVGLLFMVPGVEETLRVNGRAVLSTAAADIAACTTERRAPKLVIRVTPDAVYLHCAKAFLRSRMWDPQARVERSVLPTVGRMIADQTGLPASDETREQMLARYAPDL